MVKKRKLIIRKKNEGGTGEKKTRRNKIEE